MKLFYVIISILICLNVYAQGRETAEPLRTIDEVFKGAPSETMIELKNARIAILDYDLLKMDFPDLRDMSNLEIDNWVLSQTAFISTPQSQQLVVNTIIESTGNTREGFRPQSYGRAIVFEVSSPKDGKRIGLIDAKGTGSLSPSHKSHGNGLATLGEGLREYNYENMVRKVLVDAGLPYKTIGSYGVIDAGFDVVHADGSKSRAGIYLRQPHNRPTSNGWLPNEKRSMLNKVLSSYGIHTGYNIQGSKNGDLFDFGHYVVRNDLEGVKKQIPFAQWGYDPNPNIPFDYSKLDRPWIWAHETAEAFASGRANREDIMKHHNDMIKPIREIFFNCGNHFRKPTLSK